MCVDWGELVSERKQWRLREGQREIEIEILCVYVDREVSDLIGGNVGRGCNYIVSAAEAADTKNGESGNTKTDGA